MEDGNGSPESSLSQLSLSPVPSPLSRPYLDNINVNPQTPSNGGGGIPPNAKPNPQLADSTTKPAPKVVKRRTKKELGPGEEPKEKKPRKPRTVNPDAPSRKKAKTEAAATSSTDTQSSARPPLNHPKLPQQQTTLTSALAASIKPDNLAPATQAVRPASSGQRYDPIRGMLTSDPAPSVSLLNSSSPPTAQRTGSSTLANLMNPSENTSSPRPQQQQAATSIVTQPAAKQHPSLFEPAVNGKSSAAASSQVADLTVRTNSTSKTAPSMDPFAPKPSADKSASKPTSSVPTPKEKKPSPPRPTGSGLLSSSDLFGGGSNNDGQARKGVDIVIDIELKPSGSNVINIAQEVMRKYGKDAINPRAAAHRERLLQVAAAANRLDPGLGDDMALDGSDNEDSNVEMGGMDEDRSAAGETGDDGKLKRKRRTKFEEYDKEDDFIDDTEMAWEESAAVAQDGFFVYSGPLVREEKTKPEASAASGRGRGRGRGRSRGTTTATTHASSSASTTAGATATTTTSPAPTRGSGSGRGRGRGAPGMPRKPRMTKIAKERLEWEAREREMTAAKLVQQGQTATA